VKGAEGFVPPVSPSFDDVRADLWYYPYVEQAAQGGWILGYGNCYGTHPCAAKPAEFITRAEEAAMIVRMLNLQPTHTAAPFPDVPANAWYAEAIQTAADHGILLGEDGTRLAAPERRVTRAESVLMLSRARDTLRTSRGGAALSRQASGVSGSPYGASLLGAVGGMTGSPASVLLGFALGMVPMWLRSRRK
jgi:hypothetical protein